MKYKYFFLLIILVNATALFSGILEPDGTLYAYIAKQIALTGDYINLYNDGDWLDKPHFPFWITAISFKIFGINDFAYKLPALLFWLGGLFYLYKLGKLLYNEQTALLAVVIYGTALQATVGLFDVRAEHYLSTLTLASTYYLYKLYLTQKIQPLLLAAFFSACAIMTKGLFFLITIVSGLLIMIIIKKEWKQFVNYRWYLYLLFTLVFILPELYCIYVQFDLHPEKLVFKKTNVSGLRFFFWDSQFGRFFNTGPIKGKGDPSFFFHTILWAFLPWSILFYVAVVRLIGKRKVLYNPAQWLMIGGLLVTFIIFTLSKFQLPHYIIILFPHCALIAADFLISKEEQGKLKIFIVIQQVLLVLAILAITAMTIIYGLEYAVWIIFLVAFIGFFIFYCSKKGGLDAFVKYSVGFFALIQLFLNLFFYPNLLPYQSGETAGKWFNEKIKEPVLGLYRIENTSIKFYSDAKVKRIDDLPLKADAVDSISYYFTTKKQVDSLTAAGHPLTVIKSFQNFHISQLTGEFISARMRHSALDTMMIFKVGF